MSSKLIVILGVTGNQGGSVAERFLQPSASSKYRIRGVTRNPQSNAAVSLANRGVEIVQADLDNVDSLIAAFKGANLIYTVTNYWESFFNPQARTEAEKKGIAYEKRAYEIEKQQGINIANAAATTVETLDENGLIASTLSNSNKRSNGKRPVCHFDAKAEVFPDYVNDKLPELAKKMSCFQTGVYTSSYKIAPKGYFTKKPDGSFQMRFTTHPDKPMPHLDVNADVGEFVYAISQLPPGRSYMAEGTNCSWDEYLQTWSRIVGKSASYKQISIEEMKEVCGDKDLGTAIGKMFAYSSDPGYDGGDTDLWYAKDIRKAGIECSTTSLEQWMQKEDWSMVLDQEA